MINIVQFKRDFVTRFGREPRIFRAPARVNLIGEHTDYNDGFVMPFAIENAVYVAAAARDDDRLTVASVGFPESLDVRLNALEHTAIPDSWTRYPYGVISIVKRGGHSLHGADLLITSDVPALSLIHI